MKRLLILFLSVQLLLKVGSIGQLLMDSYVQLCAFFSIVCPLQAHASSVQWDLGVQIKFQSLFNVEIRDGHYCCCDQLSPSCEHSIACLNATKCSSRCSPYFVLRFQACPTAATCFVTKTINVNGKDAESVLSLLLIQVPFNQSELETYNQVRICNYTEM